MKKKGQVTIFIIIALVLIVSVGGYFVFKDQLGFSSFGVSSNVISIYVTDCLEKVSGEAVLGVGQGGGYFYTPEFSTLEGITYYYGKNQVFNFPLKEDLEEEISNIVSEKLFECTNNFISFSEYEIDFESPTTKTEILQDKVNIIVEYPIRITMGKDKIILKDFGTKVKVRLGLIYEVIDKIITEEPLKKGICLTCNFEYSWSNDLIIDYLNSDSTTTIFVIKDEESKIGGDSFEFIFANDYSEENGI